MSLIAGSDIAVELTRPRPVSEPGWRARELLSTAFPLVDAIAAKARRLQSDIAAWSKEEIDHGEDGDDGDDEEGEKPNPDAALTPSIVVMLRP